MTDEMEGGPRVPSELGEYQPVERLGSGGMGEVWLASKDGLIKPRALKILRPELAQDQEYRRRFFREAEIGAGLRHCRIVSVYDFGEAQGHLYLVMDFIDGVDLATLCRAVEEGGEQLPYEAMGYDEFSFWIDSGMSFGRKKASLERFIRDVMPAFA